MTIFQKPNLPLIAAGIGFVIEKFTEGSIQKLGSTIFIASLIIWSYLEITSGVSFFRKILGAVVMVFVLTKLYNQLG